MREESDGFEVISLPLPGIEEAVFPDYLTLEGRVDSRECALMFDT
jgi:hypothetical protein